MGIDSSIYSNVQPVQQPNVADSMQKALTLSNLGLQNSNAQISNQQAQYNYDSQIQARQAYQDSLDENGNLNRSQYLSKLGSINPSMALQANQQLNSMDKAQADTTAAKMAALHQTASIAAPNYSYLLKQSDEDAAKAYPNMIHQMAQQGVDISNLPPTWNRDAIQRASDVANQYKEQMDNALTAANTSSKQAETAKTYNEIGVNNDKLAQNLKDDLDPNKARAGNLAKSQAVVNASERLNQIFKQFPDYNIPKAQQTEAVSAFGAILNGGSAPLQSQLEELVPKSAKGDVTSVGAWLFNDPMGQNQQKFMSLLHDSVERERDLASEQVKTAQVQRLPAHDLFRQRNPELYSSILSGYGIKPENVQNGKYVPSEEEDDSDAPQKTLASSGKSSDLFPSANAGQKNSGISAQDAQAMQWLKSADASDPVAFKVRTKLRGKGLVK
jgi:hypothetical protein